MKTILVPTDFSTPAQNAAVYAAGLARHLGAKLILLNAYPVPSAGMDVPPIMDIISKSESVSQSGLDTVRQKLIANGGSLEIVCISRAGGTLAVIEEAAKEYAADLLVMGITGEAGVLKEKVIGSTTLDVARDLETPLIIVPDGHEYQKVENISFACDVYNLHGSSVLEGVKHFCKVLNAKLEIVNVERPSAEDLPIRQRNYNFMESILADLKHETIVLREDDSHATLQEHFNNSRADLIILSPKKQNFLQSLFHKSVTKRMLFHVKKPMLIIH